jgi:CRP/FNR family cyclic AMP-dependent transcriptional regulator
VAFNELRDRRPSIDRALAAFLGAQVRHLLGQLVDAMYSPVETRIRARLIEASEQWGPAVLPLTQQDVAELAGTTRPTANRVLHQLADEGLVVLHRSETVIADADGLRCRERGW